MLLPFGDKRPLLAADVFVASGAKIIGDVEIEEGSSVWFNAVIRGDVHSIRIGPKVNIQDLSMVHVSRARCPTVIEERVTVGHRVVIHGCHLESCCLIGMGAVIMDGARVGHHCLIGAGALITEGTQIPPEMLALGIPAKPIRPITAAEKAMLEASAEHYSRLGATYREQGQS